MKGRAVEDAEFPLMLAAVDEVIPEYAAEWKHYLTGLWLSGLRRSIQNPDFIWNNSQKVSDESIYLRLLVKVANKH